MQIKLGLFSFASTVYWKSFFPPPAPEWGYRISVTLKFTCNRMRRMKAAYWHHVALIGPVTWPWSCVWGWGGVFLMRSLEELPEYGVITSQLWQWRNYKCTWTRKYCPPRIVMTQCIDSDNAFHKHCLNCITKTSMIMNLKYDTDKTNKCHCSIHFAAPPLFCLEGHLTT